MNTTETNTEKTLNFLLRKTPGMIKHFERFEKENISFERIETVYNLIRKYKQLFSGLFENNKFESFEQLDDYINNTIIQSDKKSFVKSFISNKYSHLINDETIELFDILRKEIKTDSHKEFNDIVLKKIAVYKNCNEFNSFIGNIIKSYLGDNSLGSLKIKIKESGANIVYEDNASIIVSTPTYKSLKQIGSQSWCIVRDKSYFDQYTKSQYCKELQCDILKSKQYVIFNYTKTKHSNDYMIGVTMNSGKVTAKHLQNDSIASDKDIKRFKDILDKDSRNFKTNLDLTKANHVYYTRDIYLVQTYFNSLDINTISKFVNAIHYLENIEDDAKSFTTQVFTWLNSKFDKEYIDTVLKFLIRNGEFKKYRYLISKLNYTVSDEINVMLIDTVITSDNNIMIGTICKDKEPYFIESIGKRLCEKSKYDDGTIIVGPNSLYVLISQFNCSTSLIDSYINYLVKKSDKKEHNYSYISKTQTNREIYKPIIDSIVEKNKLSFKSIDKLCSANIIYEREKEKMIADSGLFDQLIDSYRKENKLHKILKLDNFKTAYTNIDRSIVKEAFLNWEKGYRLNDDIINIVVDYIDFDFDCSVKLLEINCSFIDKIQNIDITDELVKVIESNMFNTNYYDFSKMNKHFLTSLKHNKIKLNCLRNDLLNKDESSIIFKIRNGKKEEINNSLTITDFWSIYTEKDTSILLYFLSNDCFDITREQFETIIIPQIVFDATFTEQPQRFEDFNTRQLKNQNLSNSFEFYAIRVLELLENFKDFGSLEIFKKYSYKINYGHFLLNDHYGYGNKDFSLQAFHHLIQTSEVLNLEWLRKDYTDYKMEYDHINVQINWNMIDREHFINSDLKRLFETNHHIIKREKEREDRIEKNSYDDMIDSSLNRIKQQIDMVNTRTKI